MKKALRVGVIRAALAALLVPWGGAVAQARAPVVLRPGLVITGSVRVVPGVYRIPAPASADSAVIVVRGDGITVDFSGATMEGTDPDADPDLGAGVAIRIDGGRNIRILHARIRGYKIGILARGVHGLDLLDNDLSYNWKPRLFSLVEHESLADWLSFHHNENGEWLRYGAAIYLDGVLGGTIRGNRAEQGMNGLLMVRTDSVRVLDNVFSFNSGLGIGLYRSSDNTLMRNLVQYDVRGYSHGFYRRGQDSAGLLLYEQSCRNVVAYNAVTHGGDGLFLWAGQSTMDSGSGGANDNLFYGNDFSFAPANGIEATFSRNRFVANLVEGNDYGVWGGYSFESTFAGNRFANNRVGIAIEHGQDNAIVANRFDGDTTAISLWANPIEPSDWGYPRHRDTRSRDHRVSHNVFLANRVGVRAANTAGVLLSGNLRWAVDSVTVASDTSGFAMTGNASISEDEARVAAPVPAEYARLAPRPPHGRAEIPSSQLSRRDRSSIVVDEWGPYDWRSPKLWPLDSTRAVPLRLRVLGPPGRWRVVGRRGVGTLSSASGQVGDTVAVTPAPDSAGDWELTLEYRGAPTVSPRGERREAGQPYRFSFGRFEPPIDWSARFFAWTDSTDARGRPEAFAALLGSTPLLTRHEPRLDYEWYRPTIAGLPRERFALEATGTVALAPGWYALRTISDDAVRVWVDGVLAIDHWAPHESAVDEAPLSGGRHELRVQYYQVAGWTELRLDIVRGTQRSPGSAGPG